MPVSPSSRTVRNASNVTTTQSTAKTAAIVRTQRAGRKRVGRHLVFWGLRRTETPPRATRFGVLVSRRNGIAARRNLFKRRMREIYRRNKDRFPRGWNFLVAYKAKPGRAPDDFPPAHAALAEDFLALAPTTGKTGPTENE